MTPIPKNPTGDTPAWDAELFVLRGEDREDLRMQIAKLQRFLGAAPGTELCELSWTLNTGLPPGGVRLAIVAKSHDDLQAKLARAVGKMADPQCDKIRDISGIYFFSEPLCPQGKIAFLFPGEGAQYLNMIGGLLPHFPVVNAALAYCDEIAARPGMRMPSPRRFIAFPQTATAAEREQAEQDLRRLGNAMFSVLAADLALFHLLENFGLSPDMIAGHSAGELAALMAAGCMSDEHDATERVVETMQALEDMEDETGVEPAVLLAVGASREKLTALLQDVYSSCSATGRESLAQRDDHHAAYVAMDNCPHQTVLVGEAAAMAAVEARLQQGGYVYERLTLSRPYHTRLFEPYSAPLAEMLASIPFQAPARTLYSCTTGQPFPIEPDEMRRLTLAHWFSPVEFTQMIRNMHDAGARLFVEVGPRGNLTSFVEDILRGRQFLAVPADTPRRSGVTQLQHLLAQLAAHGAPLRLEALYEGREVKGIVDWEGCEEPVEDVNGRMLTASGTHGLDHAPVSTTRANMLASHIALMDQFLGDQEAVMQQYLAARRSGVRPARARRSTPRRTAASATAATKTRPAEATHDNPETVGLRIGDEGSHHPLSASPNPSSAIRTPQPPLPLLGEIIRHEPEQEVVMRRRLDLSEDRFAADHTVGGRMVSKVHPNHYGLPIGPMTFTLELMAETAALLVPGMVAVEVKDVRLLRWLAYYDDAPGEIEVAAKVVGAHEASLEEDGARRVPTTLEVEVRLSIVDNGNLPPGETAGAAAAGRVVLASSYPAAPPVEQFELTGRRPVRITLDGLYHDLFHGPLFTGVTELTAIGEEGIEARAVVLPRKGLLASTDDPQFLLDPVLLDVAMHPLCAWHLEQPDLAGRTLLPFELKSVKIFGPRPAEGKRFEVRGHIVESSPRHFVHGVEAFDEQGQVWCQLTAKYWRFYMPYGEINFHGRKDEYFISDSWPEALGNLSRCTDVHVRQSSPENGEDDGQVHLPSAKPRGVCVRLEPPVDLHQPAMQMVTAQVTLSADEMRQYRYLNLPPKKRFDWVFGRLAAKDAVRLLWWERHGERFFPADLEVKHDEHGRPQAVHLGYGETKLMPNVSVSHTDGMMAAVASFEPHVGIDLEKIEPRAASFEALAFDDAERGLLDQCDDREETVTRFWCAKEAVAKALGRGLSDGSRSVVVRDFDPQMGMVVVKLGTALAAEFPHFAGMRLIVFTQRYKNYIVATTFCDRA